MLYSANYTEITYNEIRICTNGIYSFGSDECTISSNEIENCYLYAIDLYEDSDLNAIYHNTFKDNNDGGTSQANDNCTGNTWYLVSRCEGNYWSDWEGPECPYDIDGTAGSQDIYPLNTRCCTYCQTCPCPYSYIGASLGVFLIALAVHRRKQKK